MTRIKPISFILLALVLFAVAPACKSEKVADAPANSFGPDYGRPLPAGASALRLVTNPQRLPNLAKAYDERDPRIFAALDQSATWFQAPSSKQFFPFGAIGVTHEQARVSVEAMKNLLEHSPSGYAFAADVQRMFDVYESVGYNGEGVVLFTGYYSPEFRGSRTPTSQFPIPLYTRPDDLVTDEWTGTPRGRRTADGGTVPYYTRSEIETRNMFAGRELVYVEDKLNAFLIHVNGSAKIRLTDGETMYIGYAGKTDRPYASLAQAMRDEKLLGKNEGSIQAIRRVYRQQPAEVERLMQRNQSYVFFTEYKGDNWPAGSLGVKVTGECSLATDKSIYPRGGVVFVDTEAVTFTGGRKPFQRFMLDQDTGGAIKAPGRADLYLGIGEAVGILAGQQYAEGRLFYFILKPQYVEQFASAAPRQ